MVKLRCLTGIVFSFGGETQQGSFNIFSPCFHDMAIFLLLFFFLFFFVCLRSVTALFPRGQLPKEDLRRSPSTTQATRHPQALSQSLFPLPPYFCHASCIRSVPSPPASGPYPPLSSCPIHIPCRVSGPFLPCFPVLHIYSNPTEKNPSTNIKPHIQTVLIHYFNKQTIKRVVYHYLVSPPVSSVPIYLFQHPSLTQ